MRHLKSVTSASHQFNHRIVAGHTRECVNTIFSIDHKVVSGRDASGCHVYCGRTRWQPKVLTKIYKSIKVYKRIPRVVLTGIQSIWSCFIAAVELHSIIDSRIGDCIFNFISVWLKTNNTWLKLIVGTSSAWLNHIFVIGVYARTHCAANVTLCFFKSRFLNQLVQRCSQKLLVGFSLKNLWEKVY